jgi:hypothetical protein
MSETKTDQYTLAGWLAIISAILLVPEIALAALSELAALGINLIVIPIHLANLIIGIYILYMFRRLLNQRFDFHATDTLITILIIVNIVFSVVGLIGLLVNTFGLSSDTEHILSIITLILFIPFCILTIVFGVRLLKLKDDLFGLLKPYAYTTIGSGVCGATIILAPIGLFVAAAALVILGMIFLRAMREAEIL